MSSLDNIRRGSHAAARDVFQLASTPLTFDKNLNKIVIVKCLLREIIVKQLQDTLLNIIFIKNITCTHHTVVSLAMFVSSFLRQPKFGRRERSFFKCVSILFSFTACYRCLGAKQRQNIIARGERYINGCD